MASELDRDIFPFPGKVKSSVWNHFGFYKDDGGLLDKSKAICRLCRRAVNYTGNTTNLRAHIVHHHKGDWGDDKELLKVWRQRIASPSAMTSHQTMLPPLTASVPQPSGSSEARSMGCGVRTFGDFSFGAVGNVENINFHEREHHHQVNAVNSALIDVLINDLIPVETLASPSFGNLIRAGSNKWELPSQEQIQEVLLQNYFHAKKRVASCLSKAESEYLKVEIWKTVQANFITVSVQVLQDTWKAHSFVVKTCPLEDGYTAQQICDVLRKTIEDWNLTEDIIILSDKNKEVAEAAAMLSCLNISSLCVAIETAAITAFDQPMMLSSIKRAREIVQFFTQSSSPGAILLEKQKLLKLPKRHLAVGDTKSWMSVLEMLEALYEQTASIVAAFNDPLLEILESGPSVKMLTPKEQTLTHGLMNMLAPMKKAITLIKDMKYPTLSIILPVLKKLEIALSSNDCDSQIIVEVKEKMLSSLKESYTSERNRILLLLSSLLDPRYKDLKFVNQSEQEIAYDLLKQTALEVVNLLNDSKEFDISKDEANTLNTPDCPIKIEIVDEHEFSSSSSEDTTSVNLLIEPLQTEQIGETAETPAKRRRKMATQSLTTTSDPMNDWLADVVQEVTSEKEDDCIAIEISRYKSELQILTTSSPLSWWKDRKKTYPILSQVAIKYISAPAILSSRDEKKEKLFQRQRASLSLEDIEMMVFLNGNYSVLNSCD